jgi:DNA (cytosine-5)-methyltransferase 1
MRQVKLRLKGAIKNMTTTHSLRYFSGFSGIGGFDQGIKQVLSGAECVGYSEVNKYAIKVYERHFPDRVNYGDIRRINAGALPDFDMFCGGFPCQDLSIAGKRAGLCGERSGLFFEIIRIIREKQPRIVFLENVKGLFSSNGGEDFARILVELDESGYDVEWQCLNSKNFGVPQNRERVFIIGHSRKESWKPVFPLGQDDRIHHEATESQITGAITCDLAKNGNNQTAQARVLVNCIDANYHKGYLNHGQRTMIQIAGTHQGNRVYSSDGLSKCISNSGGQGAKTGLILQPINIKHKAGDGKSTRQHSITDIVPSLQANCGNTQQSYVLLDIQPEIKPTIRAEHHNTEDVHFIQDKVVKRAPLKFLGRNQKSCDDGNHSFTVDGANTGGVQIGSHIRRLTPLECERLQGYPDKWTALDSDDKSISDTQRYKMLGNAVTVSVIEAIVKKIVQADTKLKEVTKS